MSPNDHRAITDISKRLEGRLARVLRLTDTVTIVARGAQPLRKLIGRLGYTAREGSGRQGVENTLPSRSDGNTTVGVPPRGWVTHGHQVAPVIAPRWNGRLAFRMKPDALPRAVPSATDLLFEGNSPHHSSARADGRSRFRVEQPASLQSGILEVVKRMTLPVKAMTFSRAEGLRSRSGIIEIRGEQNGRPNSRVGPEGRRNSIPFAAFDAGLQTYTGMKPLRRQLASLSQMSAFTPLTSDRANNQSRDASIYSPVESSHTKPTYLISSIQRLYSAASAHYPLKDTLANVYGGSAVPGTEPVLSGHTSSRPPTFDLLTGSWPGAANWATDTRSSADRYRTGRAPGAASSETSLVNYSPTIVINNGAESRTLEQRVLAVLSEHGYELSELLGREARKRRRAIF
jgi:hypothetical protein